MSNETQPPGHFSAREKALVYIELEAGWVLELVRLFWRRYNSLASAKIWTQDLPIQCTHYVAATIWTPELPGYILVSVLIMMPQTDFKIIRKPVLTEQEGRFGLDVFVSWQEFLEEFSEHVNFPWSFVKGDFLWWIMSNISPHGGNGVTGIKV